MKIKSILFFATIFLFLNVTHAQNVDLGDTLWASAYFDNGIVAQSFNQTIGYQITVHLQHDRATLMIDGHACKFQLQDGKVEKSCQETGISRIVQADLKLLSTDKTPVAQVDIYSLTNVTTTGHNDDRFLLKILKRTKLPEKDDYAATLFFQEKNNSLTYIGLSNLH